MDRRGRRGKPQGSGLYYPKKGEPSRRDRGRSDRDTEPTKPPVILAKPHPNVVDQSNEEEWPSISAASAAKVVLIKSRTRSPNVYAESKQESSGVSSLPSTEDFSDRKTVMSRTGSTGGPISARGDRQKQPGMVQIQSSNRSAAESRVTTEGAVFTNSRFATKLETASPESGRKRLGLSAAQDDPSNKSLKGGINIVSEHMDWIDNAQEFLTENSDFLVLGALGSQGTGKSTLLSMLGGNDSLDMFRQYIFRPASREATETSKHQTAGIQFYVTSTRVILLDAQAICSPAILDEMIRMDRRYNYEYKTAENFLEVESMQIAAFMLQVCHVLLVTTDWFLDLNFVRFLRSAEMLKPAVSMTDPSGYVEHFPHLVLVHQRGISDDYQIPVIRKRSQYFEKMMSGTQTLIKSGISLAKTSIKTFNNGALEGTNDVNYFVLPQMKLRGQRIESSSKLKMIPSYDTLMKELRLLVRSLPRPPFSQTQMTEKAWFQYAARAWDNVRKSHMIAEFGRTLT